VIKVALAIAGLVACAFPAWAENGVALSGQEIVALLSDRSLYAGKPGEIEQIFQTQGTTFYLVNGQSSNGTWRVVKDQYCSVWPPNPTEVCYDVARDGDAVNFVSRYGKVFPMRLAK
jgi:hypothetical protein